ncbi:protease modulator HflC [Pseudemcibacter aquimaris]|uniref:protease modulator HflC n=1 Tax=Pseudemcibacter aquimaris TaxID=2857064 RepID=UPI0020127999|nr:protease modulator HflC [Pseudemcibacter aquimaris]MCC3862162.1 protease modulator HflC [Pseudemcibacter aquimaris]WDU58915.1 protease modulator HflC [Pseudemcibacter aquimaris]
MMNKSALFGLIFVGLALVGFSVSTYQIKETNQAIILKFGEYQRTVKEAGLHFKMPIIEDVVFFDKRVRLLDMEEYTIFTSDQKRMNVDAFLEYKIEDPLRVYQALRTELRAEARLRDISESSVREVFGLQQLNTALSGERIGIINAVRESVTAEASELGIQIVDLRIKRTDLPPENSAPIFQSMIADRNQVARETRARGQEEALRITSKAERDRTVILAEATRDSEKLRGEGDAIAAKIYADAYSKDPEFYAFYRSMEVYKNAMKNGDTSMVLSPDSEFFKYFENMGGN